MGRFCPKCGAEIAEGTKFCKKCGALVESKNEMNNKVMKVQKKKSNKTPIMAIAAVVVVVILCVTFISKLSSGIGVPAYEKPLKCQVDGINKNDKKKYLSSFLSETQDHYDGSDLESLIDEVKKVSYEVTGEREMSVMSVLDTLGVLGVSSKDIEEAKTLEVQLDAETSSGETGTANVDFNVVKINGKWYAITSLSNL